MKHHIPLDSKYVIVPKKAESYSVCLEESDKFIYYIHSDGYVYRKNKSTNVIKKHKNSPFNSKRIAMVTINGNTVALATLIANTFHKRYYTGADMIVLYKDGDFMNCKADNLYYISRKDYTKLTIVQPKGEKVIIKFDDGRKVMFKSITRAAKYLGCHRTTLADALKKKISNSKVYNRYRKNVVAVSLKGGL